ncbi:MAG: hypothetical protein PHF86_04140 [Candidatus Nanoarchaeia archaeon]|nr:hypothetical protein [Candidatus Nanoarchaeia archaeon]
MSVAYSGNYEPSMYNPDGIPNAIGAQKRYRMHFQKGVPLSSNELDEIQEVSDSYIRQLITANFPSKENPVDVNCRCYSLNNGFQVVQSTDTVNNFLIRGGDGTVEGAGILIVDGYILFLKNDLEYKNQGYSTGTLVDDRYTKTWPAAPALHAPVTNPRIDVVYIDFYFAEVSATGVGIGTEPPEYKDTSLIVPGIGFSTANRVRMVQDICVMEGVESVTPVVPAIPEDEPDANGIYHRFVKIATITRDTSSNITTSMIEDNRILINSLSSYCMGTTIKDVELGPGTDLLLADGQNIGDINHRIGTIFMASIVDYSNDLRFLDGTSETEMIPGIERIRFKTNGRIGVGTTDPQEAVHIVGHERIESTYPQIDFYRTGTYLGYLSGNDDSGSEGIDLVAQGARKIRFHTNGSESACFTSTGRLGIGTTNPSQLLHVQGSCLINNDLFINGSSNFTDMGVAGKLTITQAANDNGLVVSQTGAVNDTAVVQITNAGIGPSLIVNSGRVGIGTTNPSATLHVSGNVLVDNNLTVNGTTTVINTEVTTADMLEINQNDNQVALSINQTEVGNSATVMTLHNAGTGYALLIDNGRVGIGTATPTSALDVIGTGAFSGNLSAGGDFNITGNLGVGTTTANNSKAHIIGPWSSSHSTVKIQSNEPSNITGVGFYDNVGARKGIVNWDPSYGMQISTDSGSDNIFLSSNRVGIGSSSPLQKLDVAGNINLTGDIYRPASDLAFIFDSTELFRMAYGGNFGIGTTDPQYKLHCEGQAYFNTITGAGIYLVGDNVMTDRVRTGGYVLVLEPDFPGAADSSASISISASTGSVNIIGGDSSIYVQGYEVDQKIDLNATQINFNTTGGPQHQFWGMPNTSMYTTSGYVLQVATTTNGNYSGILQLNSATGGSYVDVGVDGTFSMYGNVIHIDTTDGAQHQFWGMSNTSMYTSAGQILQVATATNGNYSGILKLDAATGESHINTGVDGTFTFYTHGVAIGSTPATFAALNIVPAGFNGQSGINFYGVESSITSGIDPSGTSNAGNLSLAGGRFPSISYGGYIRCDGNDYGSVGAGGNVYISAGNTSSGAIIHQGRTILSDNLDFNSSGTYFHATSYSEVLDINASFASDAGIIQICHGVDHGAPSSTNGAYVLVEGDGAGSDLTLSAGSGLTHGAVIIQSYQDLSLDANGHAIRFKNSNATVAEIASNGQIYSDAGTTISSPAADFAEWAAVTGDLANYCVGTIVQQSTDEDMKVEIGTGKIAYGIVTDRATFCGGFAVSDADPETVKHDFKNLSIEDLEKKYNAKRIAMTGHVLCKVVGTIKRGDRLTLCACTSPYPGVARAAKTIEETINSFAIARQSYDSTDVGLIEVRL